jgi:hypothetical protein
MRLYSILTLLILAILPSFSSAQTVNESLKLSERIHNFGTIGETDGKVSHRFIVTNVGSDTVTLLRATAGCNCVVAEVSKKPILPGKKGYIDVTYNPNYRPGHFSKEIVVYSNKQRYNRIWVKGDVTPGVHPVTETCTYNFGHDLYLNYQRIIFSIEGNGTKSVTLKLGNNGKSTQNITFKVENSSKNFALQIPETAMVKAGEIGEANVSIRVISPFSGKQTAKITPMVNGYTLSPIEVVVNGNI